MKIGIISDLHTEHWEKEHFTIVGQAVKDRLDEADIILLAGDIGSGNQAVKAANFLFPGKTICMVAGNHEFYGQTYDETISDIEKTAEAFPNLHFLNRTTYFGDGIRIIGATLWTDFDFLGTKFLTMNQVALRTYREKGGFYTPYPDFCYIYDDEDDFILPEKMLEWHMRDREWLLNEIRTPFDGKTVVMTHHAPVSFAIHPRFDNDRLNSCFASRLDFYMDADLVVWGHTHHSIDVTYGAARYVSNQLGYIRSNEAGDFGTIVVL